MGEKKTIYFTFDSNKFDPKLTNFFFQALVNSIIFFMEYFIGDDTQRGDGQLASLNIT